MGVLQLLELWETGVLSEGVCLLCFVGIERNL